MSIVNLQVVKKETMCIVNLQVVIICCILDLN